jgi:hypothetical protein
MRHDSLSGCHLFRLTAGSQFNFEHEFKMAGAADRP